MNFVYVIYSETRGKTYVGCTADVETRLKEHNSGHVKSTKSGTPWRVVYTEQLGSYTEARKRENYFKSSAGRRKLRDILGSL